MGLRGYAHLMQEHYPEAVRDLEANLALKKNPASLVALGKAQYGTKNFEKSVAAMSCWRAECRTYWQSYERFCRQRMPATAPL